MDGSASDKSVLRQNTLKIKVHLKQLSFQVIHFILFFKKGRGWIQENQQSQLYWRVAKRKPLFTCHMTSQLQFAGSHVGDFKVDLDKGSGF